MCSILVHLVMTVCHSHSPVKANSGEFSAGSSHDLRHTYHTIGKGRMDPGLPVKCMTHANIKLKHARNRGFGRAEPVWKQSTGVHPHKLAGVWTHNAGSNHGETGYTLIMHPCAETTWEKCFLWFSPVGFDFQGSVMLKTVNKYPVVFPPLYPDRLHNWPKGQRVCCPRSPKHTWTLKRNKRGGTCSAPWTAPKPLSLREFRFT